MATATATITTEYKRERYSAISTGHTSYTNFIRNLPGKILKTDSYDLERTCRKITFWTGSCEDVNKLLQIQKEHNNRPGVRIDVVVTIISNCKNGAW